MPHLTQAKAECQVYSWRATAILWRPDLAYPLVQHKSRHALAASFISLLLLAFPIVDFSQQLAHQVPVGTPFSTSSLEGSGWVYAPGQEVLGCHLTAATAVSAMF